MEYDFEILPIKSIGNATTDTVGLDYGNEKELSTEIAELNKIIEDYKIEMLIVDSYNVTEEYFIKLKEFVPILGYIDDLNKFKFKVDIIINGNIYGDELKYESYLSDTKFLLGNKYTILRSEFKDVKPITINREVNKIMITIGGSDPFNLTERLMDIVNSDVELRKYQYEVIIGSGFKNKNEIW